MPALDTRDQIRDAFTAESKRSQELKVKADRKRDEILASDEGKASLLDIKSETFNDLDALYLEADKAADNAAVLRQRLDASWLNEGSGSGTRKPYAGEERQAQSFGGRPQQSWADRLFTHEGFNAWHKKFRSTADASETAARSMFLRGFASETGPIELMTSREFKSFMEFQATQVTGGGATSAGPFIIQELAPGFVPYARKRPTMASLVGQGETNSDVVEYVTQTAATAGAAETAEGTAAAESAITFATNDTNVREITHFIPVTLRAMADAGQIRTIVELDLLAGVIDRLDTQIYAGGGTGSDLTGITIASGINTQPLGGDTRPDALHKAITQIRVAAGVLAEPDNIAMHPNDWQSLRLEKDADGDYLMGPPGMTADKQIWGIPVVMSTVVTSGQPLVGDFYNSARLWTREGIHLDSGLNEDDFAKRQISLLAAIRVAFAVTRPTGFTVVTGF